MIKLFEDFNNRKKVIYHFTESLDSLDSILYDDVLLSGERVDNYGRGYENISFTWNPNLWDIEYLGDADYRYKVRIGFDYERISKKWEFKEFDYGIEDEMEEIVETDEMKGISEFITKISISTEYGKDDMSYLKGAYPNINFVWARRKKFKVEPNLW